MRGERPFIFTNIRGGEHVDDVIAGSKKTYFWKEWSNMEQNQFGKVSVLHLNAGYKDGKTSVRMCISQRLIRSCVLLKGKTAESR